MWISDTFEAFQGTGHLTGVRQFFVRFAGCSVDCPIRQHCDEPHALTRKTAAKMTVDEVLKQARASVGDRGWLHITGGEPTEQGQALQELVQQARADGFYVHVQSSGVRRVPVQWDWLTISPKVQQLEQQFGQELIVIDDGTVSVDRLNELRQQTKFWCYYLCPRWGRDMKDTAELARASGWDLTWQMHKHAGMR